MKQGRRTVIKTELVSIPFTVSQTSSNVVKITGSQKFTLASKITLIGSGLQSTLGGLLDGNYSGTAGTNGVYSLGTKGMSIRYI